MFKFSNFGNRTNVNLRQQAAGMRTGAAIAKTAVNVTPGGGVSTPGGIRTPSTIRNQTGNPLMDNSLIDSWIPLDNMGLHQLWRRIYLRDPICGSAVDFWRELPWSDFTISGVDDPKVNQIYNECLKDALKITSWLPEISGEFLSLGKACIHFLFDKNKGYFDNLIVHNPDHLEISKVPLRNSPIKVDLKPTDDHLNFINSTDPRDQIAKKTLDPTILRLLASNQPIPLDPKNTVYLPRRAFAYDVDGISMYSRAIYFIALERPLFTASILAARRRAGPVTHIKAGNEDWEPNPNELDALAQAWLDAEEDAVSAVFATRIDVDVNRAVSSIASDLWKISDEYAFITEGKMKALGINEALLSGEATYSTVEQSLSIMLERIRAHRQLLTQTIIVDKICKEVALANDFYKRKQADIDHRVRTGNNDEDNLQIPKINWHKQLRPTADDAAVNLLNTAEEKGLPVSLKDWAGATGFHLEEAMENQKEDLDLRQQIWKYKQEMAKYSPGAPGGEGGEGGGGLESLLGGGGAPGGEGGGEGGGEEGGEKGAGLSPGRQAAFHKAVHDDGIRKYIHKMPIWDKRGMCIDIHKEEAIEKLHEPEFLRILAEGPNWSQLSETISGKYQWSPRKTDVFGYVLSRLSLVRDYPISEALATELSERIKKEGSSDSGSVGLLRELQYIAMMRQVRRAVHEGTLGKVTRLESKISSPSLLTGTQAGNK